MIADVRAELVKYIFFFSVLGRAAVQQKIIFYLLRPERSKHFFISSLADNQIDYRPPRI